MHDGSHCVSHSKLEASIASAIGNDGLFDRHELIETKTLRRVGLGSLFFSCPVPAAVHHWKTRGKMLPRLWSARRANTMNSLVCVMHD